MATERGKDDAKRMSEVLRQLITDGDRKLRRQGWSSAGDGQLGHRRAASRQSGCGTQPGWEHTLLGVELAEAETQG